MNASVPSLETPSRPPRGRRLLGGCSPACVWQARGGARSNLVRYVWYYDYCTGSKNPPARRAIRVGESTRSGDAAAEPKDAVTAARAGRPF